MFLRNAALKLAINYTHHHVAHYTSMTDAFKADTLAMKKSLCDAIRTEYYFIDALIIVFAYTVIISAVERVMANASYLW